MKHVRLSEVADFINGRAFKPEEWETEGLPIIRIQNLTGSTDTVNYYSGDVEPKYLVKDDDILISWSASLGVYRWQGGDAILNQHIFKVELKENLIDKDYFYYAAQNALAEMERHIHGATMQHITRDPFLAIEIPLPPLTEQERIASLLARADRLRQLRRTAHELGESLLQSVFLEMFGKVRGKTKEAKLGEISDIASGVTKGQNYNGRKTVEVPYLRVANVQDGYLELSEIKTIQALPSEVEELRLQVGDVVMTEGGDFDKLGRGAIWRGQIENCIHQNHIFRVRLDKAKVLPEFFENYLLSPEAKKYFLGASKQTTNLASINMTQLKQLPVPLYPLSLQEEFAGVVARVESLRGRMSEAERQVDGLFESLLAQSFGGAT